MKQYKSDDYMHYTNRMHHANIIQFLFPNRSNPADSKKCPAVSYCRHVRLCWRTIN